MVRGWKGWLGGRNLVSVGAVAADLDLLVGRHGRRQLLVGVHPLLPHCARCNFILQQWHTRGWRPGTDRPALPRHEIEQKMAVA